MRWRGSHQWLGVPEWRGGHLRAVWKARRDLIGWDYGRYCRHHDLGDLQDIRDSQAKCGNHFTYDDIWLNCLQSGVHRLMKAKI